MVCIPGRGAADQTAHAEAACPADAAQAAVQAAVQAVQAAVDQLTSAQPD